MINYEKLREEMVRKLKAEGIRDGRVLQAMRAVPRHLFMDEELRPYAYQDRALPIGCDQTISQPYIVAKMIELLELTGDEKVLEIGTGSGYQTALLAFVAREVCTIERIPELFEQAQARLAQLGIKNVKGRIGDGSLGWPEEAPFPAILVAASLPSLPPPLLEQLAPQGRLLAPVGDEQAQRLTRVRWRERQLEYEDHGGCVFVKLIGKYGWPEPAADGPERE